jgi:hypothetical protein
MDSRIGSGVDVEILNVVDDHSRFMLTCVARRSKKAADVIETFLGADRPAIRERQVNRRRAQDRHRGLRARRSESHSIRSGTRSAVAE